MDVFEELNKISKEESIKESLENFKLIGKLNHSSGITVLPSSERDDEDDNYWDTLYRKSHK